MDHNAIILLLAQPPQDSFDPEGGPIPTNTQLLVAIQRFNGTSYLLPRSVSVGDFNEQALHRIYGKSRHTSSIYNGERWLPMLLTKTVVGIGRVNFIIPCNLDTCVQLPISLRDFEQDSLLTEVYQNPVRLLRESAFTPSEASFAYDSLCSSGSSGQKVVVLRRVLDKEKTTWLLMCFLIISPALGTLIGILSHRADVGVAVGAGVLALTSLLQGLASWFS